jgi:glucose/arabinose dehydrogenase
MSDHARIRGPRLRRPLVIAALLGLVAGCSPVATPTIPPPAPAPSGAASGAASAASVTPSSGPASPSLATIPSPTATTAVRFDPQGVRLTTSVVVDGLTAPVDVTSARDGSGRLFVVEQAGRIRVVKDGHSSATPFLDITDRIASGGERGLLGLAFHPGFPSDPRFFVDYTDRDGNTVVSEFRVPEATPDQADPASERVLLHIHQPFANHNGGGVAFGNDGMLYISAGDGGSGGDPQGNGQNLDTLLAKILRIDVDTPPGAAPYVVPADNPFVGRSDARPEIWLTGLRNPWRMRFDRATGDLWIGDVGQNLWEEIDLARAGTGGLDYGWNTMEGFHCFNPTSGCDQTGLTLPVAEYGHDAGCAVIGGVVVRDHRQPRMDGGYLFSDSCSGSLWMLDPVTGPDGRSEASIVGETGASASAINDDEDGTVYLTDLVSGRLLRISAAD